MNCLIVDDDELSRTVLKHLISQVEYLSLVDECSNPVKAFSVLQKGNIDLVFLDVEMPGMTGIELIKNLEKRPIVVLITAKKDYAVEAYELNVADYIVKPVVLPRFVAAVNKAKELHEGVDGKTYLNGNGKEKEYIFVRSNSVLTKIRIKDINYIQALGDYVNIFTNEKRHTVHITLRGIEQKLPKDKFYRLHRSYLVALDQVDTVEEGTAYVEKHPLPIGEQYKKPLLKKLNLI